MEGPRLVCIHLPYCVRSLFAPQVSLCTSTFTESTEPRGRGEEWSVSSSLHCYDQRCLLGLQPTNLGTRHFRTGAICRCHPRGRAASCSSVLLLRNMTICLWAYQLEILGMVLHVNEHLWLVRSTHLKCFYVFTQCWCNALQQVCVPVYVYLHCTFTACATIYTVF